MKERAHKLLSLVHSGVMEARVSRGAAGEGGRGSEACPGSAVPDTLRSDGSAGEHAWGGAEEWQGGEAVVEACPPSAVSSLMHFGVKELCVGGLRRGEGPLLIPWWCTLSRMDVPIITPRPLAHSVLAGGLLGRYVRRCTAPGRGDARGLPCGRSSRCRRRGRGSAAEARTAEGPCRLVVGADLGCGREAGSGQDTGAGSYITRGGGTELMLAVIIWGERPLR